MKILVILGNKLNGDNTLSKAGKVRVFGGLDLHKSINFDKIILSGGITHGLKISEAFAMKKVLIENDVEEDKIILEEKSKTTVENGKYTVEILKKIQGEKQVFVLSSKNHIARKFHNPVDIFESNAKGDENIKLLYVGV